MAKFRLKIPRTDYQKVISSTTIPALRNSGDYVLSHFRDEHTDFIIYDNTKNEDYRALYVGALLPAYLKPYFVEEIVIKHEPRFEKITVMPQIGSDEVGFGDFFGPLVVVSAFVSAQDEKMLLKYGITDSKKLDDHKIIVLGHELSQKIPHTKNVVTNPKYNELIKSGYNMNKIKAMLHQNVLISLARKTSYTGKLYVDKFTSEKRFQEYTQGMSEAPIVLVAQGEAAALSIATASVLARYYFLLEMNTLNKRFKTTIPLGAGYIVDEFAKTFLKEKGRNALLAITKHNFRNFKDLDEV